jgi:apolipoprotein N-acyltransferase
MARKSSGYPWTLFVISVACLVAGFLMRSFPVFIFGGLAPLMAVTDHVRDDQRFWNLAEGILISLFAFFLAARTFEIAWLAMSLVQAISMTFAFMGYSFVYQRLGFGLGKFTIVIFWLGIEYVLAVLPGRERAVYLGDALALKTDWLHWTSLTGYAGLSLWILCVNVLLYFSLFRGTKINWFFLGMSVLSITGPIVFSYLADGRLTSRADMLALYTSKISLPAKNYIPRGEVIHKAAAGVSVLILLSALVKSKRHNG